MSHVFKDHFLGALQQVTKQWLNDLLFKQLRYFYCLYTSKKIWNQLIKKHQSFNNLHVTIAKTAITESSLRKLSIMLDNITEMFIKRIISYQFILLFSTKNYLVWYFSKRVVKQTFVVFLTKTLTTFSKKNAFNILRRLTQRYVTGCLNF